MMNGKTYRISNPVTLALAVMVPTVVCMYILERLTHNEVIPWRIAVMALLFYAAANQLTGLFVKGWFKYNAISLVCFVLMIAILLPIAHWISALKLQDLLYMKSMYVLAGVFYFLLNTLAGVFRVIHSMLITDEDP